MTNSRPTGTATEGYKDYLFPETPKAVALHTQKDAADRQRLADVSAALFHSRRGVDFEIILGTGYDSTTADADAFAKADALESWSTPVVACTVDTVLGLVQNNRRGLFAWPALAQSAFVFDEIHAYDDRLFGALLRFLRDLPGLPALLMTASLPVPRVEALREVLLKSRGIDLSPITGPEAFETRPRYHKASPEDGDPLPLITEAVRAGGKVLWVSNTVKRVMDAATRAEGAGVSPLIYHSRFKYADRVRRHQAVVEAFTPAQDKGVLAVTSQVCEMSLDLQGCTLLVTECAPVPALIQAARAPQPTRHTRRPDAAVRRVAPVGSEPFAVRASGHGGSDGLARQVARRSGYLPTSPRRSLGADRRESVRVGGERLARRRPGDHGLGATGGVPGHHGDRARRRRASDGPTRGQIHAPDAPTAEEA